MTIKLIILIASAIFYIVKQYNINKREDEKYTPPPPLPQAKPDVRQKPFGTSYPETNTTRKTSPKAPPLATKKHTPAQPSHLPTAKKHTTTPTQQNIPIYETVEYENTSQEYVSKDYFETKGKQIVDDYYKKTIDEHKPIGNAEDEAPNKQNTAYEIDIQQAFIGSLLFDRKYS